MRAIPRIVLAMLILTVTSHRLPAPIQEVPESPTPAPQQSAKLKRTIKPKVTSGSSPSSSSKVDRLFVGTWEGSIFSYTTDYTGKTTKYIGVIIGWQLMEMAGWQQVSSTKARQ
jgi:hypothetical protein